MDPLQVEHNHLSSRPIAHLLCTSSACCLSIRPYSKIQALTFGSTSPGEVALKSGCDLGDLKTPFASYGKAGDGVLDCSKQELDKKASTAYLIGSDNHYH